MGPKELFYADIFASRETGCRGLVGMPGIRDQHSGCVGTYLVEHDLFDFMLFSLPDNDAHSHKHGPHAQVDSIALADRQLARLVEAAGGPEDVPRRDHAVIVVADHAHGAIERSISLADELVRLRRCSSRPTPVPTPPRSRSARPSARR